MLWNFFTSRSCSYGNWKVPLCHSARYYLAIMLARCYTCVLFIKHTPTYTHASHSACPLSPLCVVLYCRTSPAVKVVSHPFWTPTVCSAFSSFVCIIEHYFFSTHADSLAARVLHSALIRRVWNYLQKSFLLWHLRAKLHATVVAHKMNASHTQVEPSNR